MFLDPVSGVHDQVRPVAVVRKQEKPGGFLIQAANRKDPILAAHQLEDGMLRSRTPHRGDVPARLVQGEVDPAGGFPERLAPHGDRVSVPVDRLPDLGQVAVDRYLALGDHHLGSTARGHAQFRQHLVQSLSHLDRSDTFYHEAQPLTSTGGTTMLEVDAVVSAISQELDIKNAARDRALIDSRQVVRHAANAIRALHRGEVDTAQGHLEQGREMVMATRTDLRDHPDIYWAGYVQDAQKEFAEAHLVAAMIRGAEIPGPAELGVENAPYLNGLAEAASELRRYVLDIIRKAGSGEMEEAERALRAMDDVYTSLITVDFPDSITGGLRRTTDALRAVLERTRGDLTISIRQVELERALRSNPAAGNL